MKSFLSMGWQLICFRIGPEALPYSPRLILPLIVFNLLISLGMQTLAQSGMDKPVLQLSVMALVAEALWLWLLLRRLGWQARWAQSYTGLVLVDTLITLLALPVAVLLMGQGEFWLNIAATLQIVLTLWSLSARSFVYQKALEVPRWRGLLMALAPLFMVMLLTLQFFPEIIPKPPVTTPPVATAPAEKVPVAVAPVAAVNTSPTPPLTPEATAPTQSGQ